MIYTLALKHPEAWKSTRERLYEAVRDNGKNASYGKPAW